MNYSWQLVVLALGVAFILVLNNYFSDKNEILAETNYTNCIINSDGTTPCADIKTYDIKLTK